MAKTSLSTLFSRQIGKTYGPRDKQLKKDSKEAHFIRVGIDEYLRDGSSMAFESYQQLFAHHRHLRG